MNIFGENNVNAMLHLPLGSCSWRVGSLTDASYKNLALLRFSVDDNEAVDIRRCFNDTTHIFAFGRDFKNCIVAVTLVCFFGDKCDDRGGMKTIKELMDFYDENRIYKNQQALQIQIDNDFMKEGFLTGLQIGQTDPVTGTCAVTFVFISKDEV